MMEMIELCRTKSIQEILEMPDVKERTTRYFEQDALFKDMIKRNTAIRDNVIVVDLRNEGEIYTGNRFVLYSLYPRQNISIQVLWGLNKQNIVLTCGHSIVNRTSKTDVGSLMLKYGGGGHRQVGTCQVPVDDATRILEEITAVMNADG
jgi:nanoRNase/pAp phosphatase (c-di-AMP/oligoRNAs hydrolase)